MTLSERQQRILTQMGIPIWVQRTESPSREKSHLSAAVPSSDPTPRISVVAQTTKNLGASWHWLFDANPSVRERQLLDAIEHALLIKPCERELWTAVEMHALAQDITGIQGVVVQFGVTLPHPQPTSAQVVVASSLAEMLEAPMQKKALWQALSVLRWP